MTVQCGRTLICNARVLGNSLGTAGCLLQPANAFSPRYLLTAGHVIAPETYYANAGDLIYDSQKNQIGRLAAATKPSVDGIDAAIVELAVDADPAQGGFGVPTGWGNVCWEGMAVRTFCGESGPRDGIISKASMNAPVDYGTTAGPVERILQAQIGCNFQFAGGDSGSVVLNPYGNVIGLVVANSGALGIVTPILAVLDALRAEGFDLVPVVDRHESPAATPLVATPMEPQTVRPVPITAGSPPWSGSTLGARPVVDDSNNALDILSWTLWGEAASDYDQAVDPQNNRIREKAFRAVAEVIVNRVSKPAGWGRSIETVCQSHNQQGTYQFSCWDPRGRQFKVLRSTSARATESYRVAEWTARNVLSGWQGDLTDNALNYYADYLDPAPSWAKDHKPCAIIGHHLFFNDIP